MDSASFILLLLRESGGVFESATKLQKIAFLSMFENGVEPFTEFKWHHYGPFSKELQDTVESLTERKCITEKRIERTNFLGDKYTIRKLELTNRGQRKLENSLASISSNDRLNLRKTILRFGDQPLSRVLDYVYRAYNPKDL